MRKTIWKFPLGNVGDQHVEMPKGAEILTLQMQQGILCMWVLVDPDAELETRTFETYGTGHPIVFPDTIRNYIGTYQLNGGAFVFHLFETIE